MINVHVTHHGYELLEQDYICMCVCACVRVCLRACVRDHIGQMTYSRGVSSVGMSTCVVQKPLDNLSREGPLDMSQDYSVSGATPRVMVNLPGCQYRTMTYEDTQVTTADPGYGLQLQNPRFLEYVGTPE